MLPLNDMQVAGKDLEAFLKMEFNVPVPPSGQYTYYPGTSEVPERSTANIHAVSYKALAEVILENDAKGVIFAAGSRFGGHSLFIKDGQLTYAYNFLGIPPETRFTAPAPGPGVTSWGATSARNGWVSTASPRASPVERSSKSPSTSPMTPTSTSKPTSPPPWPATDRPSGGPASSAMQGRPVHQL